MKHWAKAYWEGLKVMLFLAASIAIIGGLMVVIILLPPAAQMALVFFLIWTVFAVASKH